MQNLLNQHETSTKYRAGVWGQHANSFQAFLPSHLAFFYYVIFVLFACHKVDQVCTHAKVEHKILCRSFPHDHDHEHRLYVPGCTQIAKFKIFENPPYVQSPFKQKFFFEILIFPLAPIGFSLLGQLTLDPPLNSQQHQQKFVCACVCKVTFNSGGIPEFFFGL